MLRHATRVSPYSGRRYCVKTVPCRKCGAPVEYTTCPKWYCATCVPPQHGGRYYAKCAQARAAQREVAHVVAYDAAVQNAQPTPPGFCWRCKVIKLSVASVRGLCDGCEEEVGR